MKSICYEVNNCKVNGCKDKVQWLKQKQQNSQHLGNTISPAGGSGISKAYICSSDEATLNSDQMYFYFFVAHEVGLVRVPQLSYLTATRMCLTVSILVKLSRGVQ